MACINCQCRLEDTACMKFTGRGEPDDPYIPVAILDPNPDNDLGCGPSGVSAKLPSWIRNRPACRVYSSLDTILDPDAAGHIFFNHTDYDTDNMHDDEDDPEFVRIRTSGIYRIRLNFVWKRSNKGDRLGMIRKNSEDILAMDAFHSGENDLFTGQSVKCVEYLESGEFVEAMVKHDSGNFLRLDDNPQPALTVTFLRPPPE